jgi:hypothetical protein
MLSLILVCIVLILVLVPMVPVNEQIAMPCNQLTTNCLTGAVVVVQLGFSDNWRNGLASPVIALLIMLGVPVTPMWIWWLE